jgi:ABC-type Fe3+-siderophore transport system permease subunit
MIKSNHGIPQKRENIQNISIPCGVVTAGVGAPYFLDLLIRNQKK